MTFSTPYVGVRYQEQVTVVQRQVFAPGNFWETPLLANAALDAPQNPAVANDLVRQAGVANPTINSWQYTLPITMADGVPLQPVWLDYTGTAPDKLKLQKALGGGVPIPADFPGPFPDTDGHAAFYEPNYVSPYDQAKGRYFELYRMVAVDPSMNPVGARWKCSNGARYVRTSKSVGHANSWEFSGYKWQTPEHPDSTYQHRLWGATATSLPLIGGVITREEVERGRIEHAIALSTIVPRQAHRWPAQRNDGTSSTNPVIEGMRLRFLPDAAKPLGLHPLAGMIWDAAQTYGIVIADKAGAMSMRAEPSVAEFFAGVPGYRILEGFNWGDLRVLATGSDTTPTPLA